LQSLCFGLFASVVHEQMISDVTTQRTRSAVMPMSRGAYEHLA
jgi:hypothetical protein